MLHIYSVFAPAFAASSQLSVNILAVQQNAFISGRYRKGHAAFKNVKDGRYLPSGSTEVLDSHLTPSSSGSAVVVASLVVDREEYNPSPSFSASSVPDWWSESGRHETRGRDWSIMGVGGGWMLTTAVGGS